MMKTLLYCPDLDRAYIIKGHLESEGITAEVVNQSIATLSLTPDLEREGIRILVDEADFERAAQIVESVYPPKSPEKILCPFCHSADTSIADAADVNPLVETIRRIFYGERQKYVCHHCGRTFYKKV